jgi:hypothetical protein
MHVAKQEFPEKLSEGSSPEPGPHRVEQEFTVAVRVSFPSTDLIVYRERDLLLELVLMIGSISSNPVGALKSNTHIEILRNVMFRPVHNILRILRVYCDVLERFPAHKSVVADEGGAFAIADLESNLRIAHFGEISGTIFEEITGYLVDTGVMLHDSDFWREKHFCRTIDQAVPRLRGHVSLILATVSPRTYDSSVGIDHENDFTYTDVSRSFDSTVLGQFFG